ncbi:cytochrome P450 4c21-like [Lutzomyia longipalpis]|uniref:cytochrome P450 4c21-like n=1 Tax=Lutzomyia longipalpis TaxID=7200 RepID=UPI00248384D4|nr:cytochrome P450 4c21-like [Lutzomyia longipalpis]
MWKMEVTIMNRELNTHKNENFQFLEWSDKIAAIISKRILNPLLHWEPIYRLTSLYEEEKKGMKVLLDFATQILEDRKVYWKEHAEELKKIDAEDDEVPKVPLFFVDQLMKLFIVDKKLKEEEVIGHSRTILVGGYDTTGTTSAYLILMLAMYPEWQTKIYEEIKTILPDKNQDIQYEDLNKFDYLDRFIKETLRLFPLVPFMGRQVTETMKLGKYTIPPEATIICPILYLHRDEEIWGPTANEFDPDRFLPENMEKIHPYAYIPFSGGLRNCIGLKYANAFLRIFLIHVVRNLKFRTDLKMKDLIFDLKFLLNILNKHMVYVEKWND